MWDPCDAEAVKSGFGCANLPRSLGLCKGLFQTMIYILLQGLEIRLFCAVFGHEASWLPIRVRAEWKLWGKWGSGRNIVLNTCLP
jgi:hypothetical protein